MKCPNCTTKEMDFMLTDKGIEIDYCNDCGGVWLDKGEIYYFTNNPSELGQELMFGIDHSHPSQKVCPRTGNRMLEITVLSNKLKIDYSPSSGGHWFDGNELRTLTTSSGDDTFKFKFGKRSKPSSRRTYAMTGALPALPSLFFRSAMVLVFLYGLLSLTLITITVYTGLPPLLALLTGVAIAAIQFLLGPVITDFVLRLFYRMRWVNYDELPDHLSSFLTDICRNNRMKNPRMGIIDDGAPNAFTYGHTPNNARIVLTQGIIDLLNEDEVQAVTAHEIGHAKHWDMLIMTAAQLIPLILYYIYRTLIRMRSRRNDKFTGPRLAIAITSYVLYIISEYAVLWLSRTREYYADRFAGQQTGTPGSLASALIKIGYGLAGRNAETQKDEKHSRKPGLEAVGALGIFDKKAGLAMVVSSLASVTAAKKMGGEIDKQNLKNAMKWELWNPWAKYFELHSTHPLIAKRINHLSDQAETMGKEPYIKFDEERPESYWDEFFADMFIKLSPLLVFLVFLSACILTGQKAFLGAGISLCGFAAFVRLKFSYNIKMFPEMSISSLLKNVKVSGIRSVPCKVKGTIIGRGIPGLIWSEDFMLQDDTGIMFLDYRQPIPFWDFFFGLLKRSSYDHKEAEIIGWYRRAPLPYIELWKIQAHGEKMRTCYTYIAKYIFSVLVTVAGLILAFLFQV